MFEIRTSNFEPRTSRLVQPGQRPLPFSGVNILLSLEFIKHMKDYTGEDILEQFRFNYQIMYAVGRRNLGEL